ncbi:hypothetical protein TNCV_4602351 [Trichonephila clavipes]|nr:hypothetical protein TNCV_4602351 [Trichonephila clavipes]
MALLALVPTPLVLGDNSVGCLEPTPTLYLINDLESHVILTLRRHLLLSSPAAGAPEKEVIYIFCERMRLQTCLELIQLF